MWCPPLSLLFIIIEGQMNHLLAFLAHCFLKTITSYSFFSLSQSYFNSIIYNAFTFFTLAFNVI